MKNALYLVAGLVIAAALLVVAGGTSMWSTLTSSALDDPVSSGVQLDALEPRNPGAIATPRRLQDRWHCKTGWWFGEGASLLWTEHNSCGRLGENLETLQSLELSYDCHDLLDLGEPADVLVALISEGAAPFGTVAVGLDRDGTELWRFEQEDHGSLEAATPLWDAEGLYGVAFGPGGDEGIVAFDLAGNELWTRHPSAVLYESLTHRKLPGVLVHIGWQVQWLNHSRGGSANSIGSMLRSALQGETQNTAFLYATDGVLFPDREGRAQLLLVGVDADDGEWIIRENRAGERAWGIQVSDEQSSHQRRIKGVVTLGTAHGTTYFGLALANGTVLVLDEDGALLDLTHVPGTESNSSRTAIRDLTGGTLANGTHVLVAKTVGGFTLFEVELP